MYNSKIFFTETITQWATKKGPALQTYANARTFFESKLQNMETVQRLNANSTGSHGFGGVNAAMELQELKNGMKEAIREDN